MVAPDKDFVVAEGNVHEEIYKNIYVIYIPIHNIYTYTYTYICIYVYTHTDIYAYINVYICICIYLQYMLKKHV